MFSDFRNLLSSVQIGALLLESICHPIRQDHIRPAEKPYAALHAISIQIRYEDQSIQGLF